MDGDELFIAMEYMEGGALTDLVLTVNLELKFSIFVLSTTLDLLALELDTGVFFPNVPESSSKDHETMRSVLVDENFQN